VKENAKKKEKMWKGYNEEKSAVIMEKELREE
jgi:hypothetical protein